jgi:hypothetical protein
MPADTVSSDTGAEALFKILKSGHTSFRYTCLCPLQALHAPAVLPPIAIEREAARVPEPVWTFGEEKNLLLLPGLEPRILQPIA